MSDHKHGGFLGAVYGAKDADDVAALYDKWASTYDAEMADAGYRHPAACVALFARHVMRGSAPVLDAGAGTGLMGQWLQTLGYPEVEALDVSQGMLDIARQKNLYTAYHKLALGGPLPFARVAGVSRAAGVHAKATGAPTGRRTDLAGLDPAVVMGDGRAVLRAIDLMELASLVKRLSDRSAARQSSKM